MTIQGWCCVSTLDTGHLDAPRAVECVACYYDLEYRALLRRSGSWEDEPGQHHLVAVEAPENAFIYTDRRLAIEAYAREQGIAEYRALAMGLLEGEAA